MGHFFLDTQYLTGGVHQIILKIWCPPRSNFHTYKPLSKDKPIFLGKCAPSVYLPYVKFLCMYVQCTHTKNGTGLKTYDVC